MKAVIAKEGRDIHLNMFKPDCVQKCVKQQFGNLGSKTSTDILTYTEPTVNGLITLIWNVFYKTYRFLEVPFAVNIVETETDSSLVEPNFPHHVVEEMHDGYPPIGVVL